MTASAPDVVQIARLGSLESLQNPTLRRRAIRAHIRRSREFVAYSAREEAALLVYDDWSDRAVAFVQEIFVLPQFRRQGIATRLLECAESLALDQRCKCVRLKPHRLDDDTDQAQLEAWYAKMGYRPSASDREAVEKALAMAGRTGAA